MLIPEPVQCRHQAFELFAAQLPVLESIPGLLRASVAVAMHRMDDASMPEVEARLDDYARRILRRLRNRQPRALTAHLHDVLFGDEQFEGNAEDYYNPLNSYLPAVLENKRGLPVTLSLIYKGVAERIGLTVHGINAPGHFMVGVELDRHAPLMLIDPFFAGRAVSRQEAIDRVEQLMGVRATATEQERWLEPSPHRHWMARLLQNLQAVFSRTGAATDLAAMLELRHLLEATGRL